MKTIIINLSDIKIRKPFAPSCSYHRNKKQEQKHGLSKHPKKSFEAYLKEQY